MEWEQLEDIAALDRAIRRSAEVPVLIYKHSTRCHISAMALDRLERDWSPDVQNKMAVYFLDVLRRREVSDEAARRFGVAHASPQALLIRNGACVFHASHSAIRLGTFLEAAR